MVTRVIRAVRAVLGRAVHTSVIPAQWGRSWRPPASTLGKSTILRSMGWLAQKAGNAVDWAVSRSPSGSIASKPLFAQAFASFLRHNAPTWRIRRIDRFEPVDINLARQHTTVQGCLDAEL